MDSGPLLFLIVFTALQLGILFAFFKLEKEARDLKIASLCAGILFGADILITIFNPSSDAPLTYFAVAMMVLSVLKFFIAFVVGMTLARSMGFQWSYYHHRAVSRNYAAPLLWSIISAAVLVAYSYGLFSITHPLFAAAIPPNAADAVSSQKHQMAALGVGTIFILAYAMFEVAIVEEIVFRFCISLFLGKLFLRFGKGLELGAYASLCLWILSHMGTLSPEWVKFVQVLPLGLTSWWLLKKYGIEFAILTHTIFNVAMIFVVRTYFPEIAG